jgi:putative transposase
VCKTGCQWNHLHVDGGSWKTVFHNFNLWSKLRLFENSFYRCASYVSTANVVVDTSFVKNVCGRDVVGRNPTDRGRKATKVSLITNEEGTPLTTCFHRANKNDGITHLLDTCARKTSKLKDATTLLADKGYDSEVCRSVCRSHNLEPMIPKRGGRDIYKG